MRNMIRTALIVGTLATPMIAMADTHKKDEAAKTEEKAAPKTDEKATAKDDKAAKKDAKKAPEKKDAAKTEAPKDVKAPETK